MCKSATASKLTTYLTYQATLGSHSGQVSLHPRPCQGPFELLVHQWSSLWNRELPMPHLFSQHSVRCLLSHIYPVIQYKLIMLCAHAYALMVHNRFHQFCGTMKTPWRDHTKIHYTTRHTYTWCAAEYGTLNRIRNEKSKDGRHIQGYS